MRRLPIPDAHVQALAALRNTYPDLPVVVIGAAAVGYHVTLARPTRDVDLVVVVPPTEVRSLVEPLQWNQDERVSIRWHGPEDFHTDILPASKDLLAEGVLQLDDGDRELNLLGLDLALTHAIEIALDGELTIRVATLEALTVLKMVAWLDRPTERDRDLEDLAALLDGALADDDVRRWDPPLVTVSHDRQSPYFVGLAVGEIVNDQHAEAIDRFLAALLHENGRWSAQMARVARHPAVDGDNRVRAMLEAFRAGVDARRAGSP